MKHFLLIDDHEIIRSGVQNVLEAIFSPCKIYEADNETSALLALERRSYDLIIMDVQIPDSDMAGLMEYIKTHYPNASVLMFSMLSENIYAKQFLKAGAMGFVSKSASVPDLKKAIELVLDGHQYIGETLVKQLAGERGMRQTSNPFNKLSAREFQIATLLINGKKSIEISKLFAITPSTIATHKMHLFEKLRVSNLPELLELARLYKLHVK